MQSLVDWYNGSLGSFMPKEVFVFLVSMLPIIELRGGLVVASLLKIPLLEANILCIIGNIIPIPFILLLIKKVLHWMADHHMGRLAGWIERKAEKNKPKIDKYGFWGLALFVGIPLPGTGAWTGSLVASVFDMDLKKASISILIGVALAAVIMTVLSYGLLGGLLG